MGQRPDHTARTIVGDDRGAVGQDRRLGDVAYKLDIGRLRSELGRINLPPHGRTDMDGRYGETKHLNQVEPA